MESLFTSDTSTIDHPVLHDCWNQIGVMGNRTCSELKAVIHCHECSVYAAVGDSLLEREPPLNYVDEWISILAEIPVEQKEFESNGAIIRATEALSVMIFRLENQKLALPVRILQEITHPCTIQPLPHRSNELFLGLVNIRGEILLCASLSKLLNLDQSEKSSATSSPGNTKRMIVAGQRDDKWVFPVDEVYGNYRFHSNELRDPPVVITKAAEAYTEGVIHWQSDKVNYLDSELLFYTLNRKIL